uniref:BPTI/Kunitz inhibitor domain-containing protein n=1 Tax=Syphacia muris TaxID=451379 RepID=A0A0N5AUC7_9BILA
MKKKNEKRQIIIGWEETEGEKWQNKITEGRRNSNNSHRPSKTYTLTAQFKSAESAEVSSSLMTMISLPSLLLQTFIIALLQLITVNASLPTELDPFLELLFDTTECEEFIGDAEYLSVATVECKPFKCDFPRQLCMRPAMKLTDESTNQCRDIPEKCLTAANGGISLRKGVQVKKPSPTPKPSTVSPVPEVQPSVSLKSLKTQKPEVIDGICDMNQPEGRFCGFKVMYAYNKENRRCEQFWFPGCRTKETNLNLFQNEDECVKATSHCTLTSTIVAATTVSTTPMTTIEESTEASEKITRRSNRKPIFTVKPPKETPQSFGQSFNLQSLISGATGLSSLAGSALSGSSSTTGESNKGSLLGLITDGISQFTNSGGFDPDSESSGNFLENFNLDKIPQLIKTLQEVKTSGGSSSWDFLNPLPSSSAGWQQVRPQPVTYPVYSGYSSMYGSNYMPMYHQQPFRYRHVTS